MYRHFIPYNRKPSNKRSLPSRQLPPKSGLKRALLIGINYIDNKNYTLLGCINDIINIRNILRKLYPNCTDIRSLSDNNANPLNKPTRANILAGINWLTSGLRAGDSVFLHYSGHGGLTIDRSGDEISRRDSCIYPISKGTIETILDDELRSLLVTKLPKGCKCFAVFDSCNSGSVLDLRYSYDAPDSNTIVMKQNDRYPETPGSVVLLSGCSDSQSAEDTYDANNIPTGAMTNALLKIWNSSGVSINFKNLLWNIRKNLRSDGYPQVPQLSCSASININNVFQL